MLVALCALWVLTGVVGHTPWKGGDGLAFLAWLATGSGEAQMPPLYYGAGAFTAWMTGGVLPLHDGVRLASAVFMAVTLVFIGRAAQALYGAAGKWLAVLALLGAVGLLVRGHETNPYLAQLALLAVMLDALARAPQARQAGWQLGLGGGLLALAGGLAEALMLILLAFLLAWRLPDWRAAGVGFRLLPGVLAGGFAAGLAVAALAGAGWPMAAVLGLDRWGIAPSAYFAGILGWFTWPLWPLAAWALYTQRRQLGSLPALLPLAVFAGLMGLMAFLARPGEEQALPLLLPLALLAGAGLMTLKRGAAQALMWFGLTLSGFLALVIWVYWMAHDLGTPARLADRLVRLGMEDTGSLRAGALALGLAVTGGWVWALVKLPRTALRPIAVWTTGLTFVWVLLFALFLRPLDARVGYAGLAARLAMQVPPEVCVGTLAVRREAAGLLAYHSGRRLVASEGGCDWLLVQLRKGEAPTVPAGWQPVAEIARPETRDDQFRLYRR